MTNLEFLKAMKEICGNNIKCEKCPINLDNYCLAAAGDFASISDEDLLKLVEKVESIAATREQKVKKMLNADNSLDFSTLLYPCDCNENYATPECDKKTMEECRECSKDYWNEIIFD